MTISIRAKLLAAFGLNIVLIAILGSVALIQMGAMNEQTTFLTTDTLSGLDIVNHMNVAIGKYRALQAESITNDTAAEITRIENDIHDLEVQMDGYLKAYAPLADPGDESTTFEHIRTIWPDFTTATDQELIPLSRVNDTTKAIVVFNRVDTLHKDLVTSGDQLAQIVQGEATGVIQDTQSTYTTARYLVIGIIIAVLVLAAALGFFLSSAIARNVRLLTEATAAVTAGDLTRTVTIRSRDELGTLGTSFNQMTAGLHRITSQIQQANSAIAASAAEILAATTQQAASAAEQSAAVTQTTTTIEEVKAIALQTAQQASQVAQDSQSALVVARQGTQAIEDTVNGMAQIRTRVEGIAQTILALADQTQLISSIITTVSELADQSNLLALNAAIEAARAGEQGKSFAVVAQHVRELAERSKGATGQVKQILGEIQKATNAAVLVTEEGTKGVEVGGRLAGQAGQVIHRIAAEVESGAQASVQIAAAAQQQTSGMVQIGQAMTSIQQATTQALASTRQAERAGQDLHTLAQSLQRAISVYQL
jgi:methyl-accepting chemotaxis protein